MMACAYTAGDLDSLYWLLEDEYGTTPSETGEGGVSSLPFIPGPYLTSWSRGDDRKRYRQYLPGSRSYDVNSSVDQGNDVAFSVAGPLRSNNDWAGPLISGALGISDGMTETNDLGILPSYSMLLRLGSSIKNNLAQVLYNGCKVNALTLSADQPKAVITASADIHAQYAEKVAGNAVEGLQAMSLTVPADPVISRPAALQWDSGIVMDDMPIYPVSWSLDVQNGLGRTVGPKEGADGERHVVTRCLAEGQRSITMSMVCWFSDYEQIQRQLDNEIIGYLDVKLSNGRSICLERGRYTLSFPEHTQDRHQITMNTDWAGAVVV